MINVGGKNVSKQVSELKADIAKDLVLMSRYAIGDGTDETTPIQTAINDSAGKILLWTKQNGTNYVTNPLSIPANVHIIFEPGTLVKAKTGYGLNDRMFSTQGNNITIEGNYATLQMIKSEYTSGEQRHCFFILGCENVTIRDLVIKDTGGDAVLVGGDPYDGPYRWSKNVRVLNCLLDNNRRQGVSIVGGAEDIILDGNTITNTSGTLPQSGIDLEPNDLTYDNINITVSNNTLKDNADGILVYNNSYGVKIFGNKLKNSKGILVSRTASGNPTPTVTVRDNYIESSSASGIYLNNVHNITVSRNVIKSPAGSGIYLQQSIASSSYNNRIHMNEVYDAGSKGIVLESSMNCSIFKNHIENTVSDAISLTTGCDYTEIRENYLRSCNSQASRGAIDIRTSSYCMVKGNIIRKISQVTAFGIYIQIACVETIIEDNDLYTSATSAYYSDSTSTVVKVNRWLDGSVSPYRNAGTPTANNSWLGTTFLKINGAGSLDDTYFVCIKNGSGVAVWKQITLT